MGRRSCFVVMPIGSQQCGETTVSAADLRRRYDDLIKEALLKAAPQLDIVRADDVAAPGTITSDILARLMHSDIVVADVTYPNPNVFYELGLRHACRAGTIIIKDRDAPRVPFDIAPLRHIEYENSPTGLKKLADDFSACLEFMDKNPERPDNHFQELAKLTAYEFPDYGRREPEADPETEAVIAMIQTPEVLQLLARKASGEEVDQAAIAGAMLKNPQVAGLMAKALVRSGQLSLGLNVPTQSQRPATSNVPRLAKAKRRKNRRR